MSIKVMQATVVSQAAPNPNQQSVQLALFGADGDPISVAPDTGATVVLTGYDTGGAAGTVAAADTVNAAIRKLEARIVALETP
jgi:hypothetical protein